MVFPEINSSKNPNKRNLGSSKFPPQFTPSFLIMRKKLRFQAASASTTTITPENLGDLWCVAATATSAYQLASNVRLRKIEMWGPMTDTLVPVSVRIDWTGSAGPGSFGKSNRVSDTSMGSMEPAHVVSRPPPDTQIGQWLNAQDATTNLCLITYPANAIIDVTYDLVVRDNGTAYAVGGAVAGATVGANYVRALDSVTGSILVPVDMQTI